MAPSAFLASVNATKDLQSSILRSSDTFSDADHSHALFFWTNLYNHSAPAGEAANIQNNWDAPAVEIPFKEVFDSQTDATDRARLLAVSSPRSSDWLHALPIAACGLHLDDEATRVAVGFRLGSRLCEPHSCPCGAVVDAKGIHSLSCRKSAGRAIRHHNLNDIIW